MEFLFASTFYDYHVGSNHLKRDLNLEQSEIGSILPKEKTLIQSFISFWLLYTSTDWTFGIASLILLTTFRFMSRK